MKLMQIIESMHTTIQSLLDELARQREKDAEHFAEHKQLMALIEDKDKNMSLLSQQMSQLIGEISSLRKALEYLSIRVVWSSEEIPTNFAVVNQYTDSYDIKYTA